MNSTGTFQRIGIISGVVNELAAFLPDLPRSSVNGSGLPVGHLSWEGKELFLICAGIGKVAAATAATILHARFEVDLVIVIGTAGKIAEIDGHVFNIVEAVQGDYGAQRHDGLTHYSPGTLPIGPVDLQAFKAFELADLPLPRARIATSDLFVECGVHAGRLRDALSVALVDMETAAVAQTASLVGIPWIAIKATTDGADDDSAGAFMANLDAAARASAVAAEEILSRI
jgi:5'-methylthioadenosine/S-adenosylhomocysteine nucleosidase